MSAASTVAGYRQCAAAGCDRSIDHRAPDATTCSAAHRQKVYRERTRLAGSPAMSKADKALLARHDIAVKGIAEIDDPRRRAGVLYAVVWPELWLQETAT